MKAVNGLGYLGRRFASKVNLSDTKNNFQKLDAFYDLETCNRIDINKLSEKKKSLFNLNALDLDLDYDNISLTSLNSDLTSFSQDNDKEKKKIDVTRDENDCTGEKPEKKLSLLKWLQELN